ncbi:hypothetical protein Cenrod_0721 [Candidatus Symbiobacter mobilis CR]|uniref:Lipoprotein n=1 Tax=Candidatus Symbiobacter mobilis CR TaxID=946483 RepID=U5N9C8_9BURK|nr:hypothetical protein Cenrod_0721 [Candidatus Symbiobacter mobilis CR]
MKKTFATILVLPVTVALGSCTSQQLYGVGQSWQRNECLKIADQQERSRCLSSASTSYEQYKRESQAVPEPK